MLADMPTGKMLRQALLEQGVTHAVTVPDWVQIGLHQAIANDPDKEITMVPVCTEDEAITVAGGLHIGGAKPVIVIQNQGLYAGINSLRAVGLDAGFPLVLFIGQFGREVANYAEEPASSSRRVVRLLEPILDTLEIKQWRVDGQEDLGAINLAFESAYRDETPTAVLFGRNIPLET